MKEKSFRLLSIMLFICLLFTAYAWADPAELQRITADQAFNAVQTQTDPLSGETKKVVLVDVRTRAEFFWVGAACKVNSITLEDDTTIIPDLGKAHLVNDGRYIMIQYKHWPQFLPVGKVKAVDMSPIAINIPFKLWDEDHAKLNLNENFQSEVEALAKEQGVQVVIFFCRSGDRSEACQTAFNTGLFETVYEIDRPDLQNGTGGFEGASYNNVFIGYRGFPLRDTQSQQAPSVSWKDSALPIKTGLNPLTP